MSQPGHPRGTNRGDRPRRSDGQDDRRGTARLRRGQRRPPAASAMPASIPKACCRSWWSIRPTSSKAAGRTLARIGVDGRRQSGCVAWAQAEMGHSLGVVARPPGAKGFAVLPRRCVVERSFTWMGSSRRPSKDYEAPTATSEAMIWTAFATAMLRRLVKRGTSSPRSQSWAVSQPPRSTMAAQWEAGQTSTLPAMAKGVRNATRCCRSSASAMR